MLMWVISTTQPHTHKGRGAQWEEGGGQILLFIMIKWSSRTEINGQVGILPKINNKMNEVNLPLITWLSPTCYYYEDILRTSSCNNIICGVGVLSYIFIDTHIYHEEDIALISFDLLPSNLLNGSKNNALLHLTLLISGIKEILVLNRQWSKKLTSLTEDDES